MPAPGLITRSDGRPDDQDGCRGAYRIEDTRQALFEARHEGVHPFCITIDDEAMDYLPHRFGAANCTVVSDVRSLPCRVSDIYRHISVLGRMGNPLPGRTRYEGGPLAARGVR